MCLSKTSLILSFKIYQEESTLMFRGGWGGTWTKGHRVGSDRRNAHSDCNNVHWPCLANASFLAANWRKAAKFRDRSLISANRLQQSYDGQQRGNQAPQEGLGYGRLPAPSAAQPGSVGTRQGFPWTRSHHARTWVSHPAIHPFFITSV